MPTIMPLCLKCVSTLLQFWCKKLKDYRFLALIAVRVVEDPLFEITERVDDDEYGDDPRFLFTLTNPYQIPPTQFYNDGHQYFANGYSIMIYAKSTLNADSHIEFSTTYADST
ncbi:unnamed protein product, partial [Didymodactylos carnosus]